MAGKIQNEDIKSSAELISAGGTAAQLPNDTKVYVTASSINKTLNQAIIDGDIGGGSGGINYIPLSQSNGASASGWTVYANAAGVAPVNGTGGSPSSTFATSANTSLIGANNYLWTKSAANRQGEGFSYNFSIDAGYQAKPMTISFLYSIASGTYASGDMTVWIYDVTNAVLIQPSAYSILNGSGAIIQKCEFQSASNSTSYRLIVHTSSTSASAYSLRFDSFSVGPNTYNFGSVVTEPVAYTPTFTGFGTVSTSNVRSWRVGANLHILGTFTSGTPTATEARISLGFGGVNGAVNSVSGLPTVQAVGNWFINSNGAATDSVLIESSVGYLTFGHGYASGSPLTKANGNGIVGAGSIMSFYAIVPIAGWGTSQVLSSDTDTRVVDFQAVKSAGSYTTPNALTTWSIVNRDSHGAFNSSTGVYTIPVVGDYWFHGKVNTSVTTTLNLFKNGSAIFTGTNGSSSAGITVSYLAVGCVAGDTFYLSMPDSGTITTNTAPYSTAFSGSRISGPSQIAANESVIAIYSTTVSANASTVNPVQWSTRVVDTHGSVTTGSSWKFTAPISGIYAFSPSFYLSTAATVSAVLYKNGSSNSYVGSGVSNSFPQGGTGFVRMLAGDYVDIRLSGSQTIAADALNNINIQRIGNY